MFSKQGTDKLREVFDTLFKASGDDERSDKLGEQRLVESEMIRRSEIVAHELTDDSDGTFRGLRLVDLKRMLGVRTTRVPVFAPGDLFRCVIHRSLIDQHLADVGIEAVTGPSPVAPDYDELTVGTLLDADKDCAAIRDNIAFIPPSATLGEAKKAMLLLEGCHDVFVTERGDRNGKVLGWLARLRNAEESTKHISK